MGETIEQIDEVESCKEKVMLEKVNALVKQIKWTRTRDRHAKKAVMFM